MNLRLLQISDSALPIGSYTHSWGLEAARGRGLVEDAASLEQWVAGWLRHSLAPFEGVVVTAVCRAVRCRDWSVVERANELLEVGIAPPSLRSSSREMGELLLSLAGTWEWSGGELARCTVKGTWHHAAAFGVLGALAGGTPRETVLVYLHQAALGMIAAGVRAVPVGHTHGQQILAYLQAAIEELAEGCVDRELESAGSYCPFYEVLCDEQTRLYSRVFRS